MDIVAVAVSALVASINNPSVLGMHFNLHFNCKAHFGTAAAAAPSHTVIIRGREGEIASETETLGEIWTSGGLSFADASADCHLAPEPIRCLFACLPNYPLFNFLLLNHLLLMVMMMVMMMMITRKVQ